MPKRKLTCRIRSSVSPGTPPHTPPRTRARGQQHRSLRTPPTDELHLRSAPASTRLTRAGSRDDGPLPDERSAPGSAPCGGPTDPRRAFVAGLPEAVLPEAGLLLHLQEGLEGRARAHEVAVAVGVVDARDGRPELVLLEAGLRLGLGLGLGVGSGLFCLRPACG